MELGGPAYGVLPTVESHGCSDVAMASLVFVSKGHCGLQGTGHRGLEDAFRRHCSDQEGRGVSFPNLTQVAEPLLMDTSLM